MKEKRGENYTVTQTVQGIYQQSKKWRDYWEVDSCTKDASRQRSSRVVTEFVEHSALSGSQSFRPPVLTVVTAELLAKRERIAQKPDNAVTNLFVKVNQFIILLLII